MNALTFPLLRFLADGHIRSFAEIGDMLGVSATEIAETLDGLLSMGLKIERDLHYGPKSLRELQEQHRQMRGE